MLLFIVIIILIFKNFIFIIEFKNYSAYDSEYEIRFNNSFIIENQRLYMESKDCYSLQNQSEKEYCIYSINRFLKDSSLCNKIEDYVIKKSCKRDINIQKSEIILCQTNLEERNKDLCTNLLKDFEGSINKNDSIIYIICSNDCSYKIVSTPHDFKGLNFRVGKNLVDEEIEIINVERKKEVKGKLNSSNCSGISFEYTISNDKKRIINYPCDNQIHIFSITEPY